MPAKMISACVTCNKVIELPFSPDSNGIVFQHPHFNVFGERYFCSDKCWKLFRAYSIPPILYNGETQESLRVELDNAS